MRSPAAVCHARRRSHSPPEARSSSQPGLDRFIDRARPAGPVDPTAKARVVPPPGNGRVSHRTPGASYQTRGQDSGTRIARRRSENNIKTTVTTPEPTARSAQESSRAGSGSQSAGEPGPARQHPPARPARRRSPVVRDAAGSTGGPARGRARATGKSAANKPDPKSETPAAEASEVELTSINLPAPEPPLPRASGPGLTRFLAVDLKLAGGSLPSTAGLDWLVEKGYRTLLDLRESSEVPPTFIAEATKRGLAIHRAADRPGFDRSRTCRTIRI